MNRVFPQASDCYWRLLRSEPGDSGCLSRVSSGTEPSHFEYFPAADAPMTSCSCQLVAQVEACRLYSKFSARPSNLEAIPSVVEKVVNYLIVVFPAVYSLLIDNKMGNANCYCLFCPKAVRCSIYGRPGACYVDIAGDMVNTKVDRSKVRLGVFFSFLFICVASSLLCL